MEKIDYNLPTNQHANRNDDTLFAFEPRGPAGKILDLAGYALTDDSFIDVTSCYIRLLGTPQAIQALKNGLDSFLEPDEANVEADPEMLAWLNNSP